MNRFKFYRITFCRITKCLANYCYFLIISPISISWNIGNTAVLSLKWVLITLSCLTLYDPLNCSPQSSSVHGILQARILEWVTIPFSRGSSQPRYWTQVSRMAAGFFTIWATRETSLSSWKHGLRSSYLGVAGHGVSRALIWAEWPSENVFLFKISQYLI